MGDWVIREVRPEDAAALAALWHRVFEDPEELSRDFLAHLPELGGGVTAQENGVLLGAAYAVTDYFLAEQRLAYLYAVAVLPEARGRGLGLALSREASALGRRLGAGIVCTSPAEPRLYPWYERAIGARCALRLREERIGSRPGAIPRPLSPAAYGERREALLAGKSHVRPGAAVLRQEQFNCRVCGGDLLALDEGIAAAYVEGERTLIRELLAPDGADRRSLAAAVGAALGTEEVLLLSAAEEGEPYLASDRPLPPGCVWNLILD